MGSPSPNVSITSSPGKSASQRALAPPEPPAASSTTAHILSYLGACTVYVAAGPVLILLNNTIIHEHRFPFPIALSAFGVGFSALVSHIIFRARFLSFKQPQLVASRDFFWSRALPIGTLSAMTLALGNASYVYLSVAVCQMLKAFTPAITLGFLFLLRVETPSVAEVGCVALITLGTVVSVRGDLALSQLGLLLQLGANCAEAARIVLSQQLLASMKLPLLEMQFHVAPPQLLCLVIASAIFELRDPAARTAAMESLAAYPMPFAAAAILGLLLQVAGLLAVKIAGSVAVKLLGIARGAGLVLFEAVRATDPAKVPTPVQLGGYATSMGGFLLYTWIRLRTQQVADPQRAIPRKTRAGSQRTKDGKVD